MKLPFYFDYACPWAYLGRARAEAYFAEAGAELDFRPVYLPLLREPGAGGLPELGERKKRNYRSDLLHWAELCGAPPAGAAAGASSVGPPPPRRPWIDSPPRNPGPYSDCGTGDLSTTVAATATPVAHQRRNTTRFVTSGLLGSQRRKSYTAPKDPEPLNTERRSNGVILGCPQEILRLSVSPFLRV